jgi:hypothetical protein
MQLSTMQLLTIQFVSVAVALIVKLLDFFFDTLG